LLVSQFQLNYFLQPIKFEGLNFGIFFISDDWTTEQPSQDFNTLETMMTSSPVATFAPVQFGTNSDDWNQPANQDFTLDSLSIMTTSPVPTAAQVYDADANVRTDVPKPMANASGYVFDGAKVNFLRLLAEMHCAT